MPCPTQGGPCTTKYSSDKGVCGGIAERWLRSGANLCMDLHKAFDCLSRLNMRELLFESGFSETAAELLLQLWEHEIVLRLDSDTLRL